MSDTLTRIHRVSRPLTHLTSVALVALPLGLLIAAGTGAMSEDRLRTSFEFVTLPAQISTFAMTLIWVFAGVSATLLWLALWQMRRLFALYGSGDVFGPDAARCIRRIGWLLMALAGVGVLSNTLTVLALTWPNPPGERSLSIGFGTDDLFLFFAAALLTVIGWAMAEAARIADENRGFI